MSRHKRERVLIGDEIIIEVTDIRGDKVRLGITAPIETPVDREEVRLKADYRTRGQSGEGTES